MPLQNIYFSGINYCIIDPYKYKEVLNDLIIRFIINHISIQMVTMTEYSIDFRNMISIPFSTLSALGCICIFLVFLNDRNIRSKPLYKLVFNLSLMDFVRTLAGIYVPPSALSNPRDIGCNIESYLIHFTDLSSILFSTAFMIKIYNLVCRDKPMENCMSLKKTYIACYGLPFITSTGFLIASLLKSTPIFGFDKCFCIVDNSQQQNIAYLGISFYGPFTIFGIYCFHMYLKIERNIKKMNLEKSSRKFMLYPLLLFLGSVPALVNWICELCGVDKEEVIYIHYINTALSQCKGLWNTIVFIGTRGLKNGLPFYSCCQPNDEEKPYRKYRNLQN